MGINHWIVHISSLGLLFVWNLFNLMQRTTSPTVFIPYDIHATDVNWSGYDFTKIPDVLQKITKVSSLDLSKNQLQAIEPNVFENLTQLEEVNLSGNANLIVPENECFLISNYIKVLNVSFIASIEVIKPSQVSCLPNLTDLVLIMSRNCKATRSLFEGTGVKVSCKRGQYQRKDTPPTPSVPEVRQREKTQPTPSAPDEDVKPTQRGVPTSTGQPRSQSPAANAWVLHVVLGVILGVMVGGVAGWGCTVWWYHPREGNGEADEDEADDVDGLVDEHVGNANERFELFKNMVH